MKVVVEFNRLPALEREAPARVDQALQDGAVEIQATSQRIVPVDTGRLRASLTTNKTGDLSYEVGTDVNYARFVEQGTRYQAAQPYLRPSYERHRIGIVNSVKKALDNL